MLDGIAGLYNAVDEAAFDARLLRLGEHLENLDAVLGDGPYFAGREFGLVDAAFAPVFRYFDILDLFIHHDLFERAPKVLAWRGALARRPSVRAAVTEDYPERLTLFLRARNTHLSRLMATAALPSQAGVSVGHRS